MDQNNNSENIRKQMLLKHQNFLKQKQAHEELKNLNINIENKNNDNILTELTLKITQKFQSELTNPKS